MFQFEKFTVYIKTEEFVKELQPILNDFKVNINSRNQLYRASSSILLNIAEGSGKFSKNDKKNFYIIARGSVQECVSILRLLIIEGNIDKLKYLKLYNMLTEISKMISGLINSMLK